MTIIVGIDPGSQRTGYGVIEIIGNRYHYHASGFLDLTKYPARERLRQVYLGVKTVIELYKPQEAAIEDVFMHENPRSALKLGQARGAAMVAFDIPISEYAARVIKKSVVGHGAAKKEQVQYMVAHILNLKGKLQADAADALAVALCHANMRKLAHHMR